MSGAELYMGYLTKANKALYVKVVVKILNMIKAEAIFHPGNIGREMLKVGTAMAVTHMGSLRGPEVLMLDLVGICTYISKGINGTMPEVNTLEVGKDLFEAPHI